MPLPYLTIYTIMASAIFVGVFRFRKLSVSSRRLLVLISITFVVELAGYWVGHIYRTNLIIYHYFTPLQYVLLAYVYAAELNRQRRVLLLFVVLAVIGGIVDLVAYQGQLTKVFPTLLKSGIDLLSIGMILLYLYQLISLPTEHPFTQYPLFWLSTGWLLLVLFSFVSLSAFNYISANEKGYALFLFYIRTGADFQLYALLIVAFLSRQRMING